MESLLELQLPNDNKKNNDNTVIIPVFSLICFMIYVLVDFDQILESKELEKKRPIAYVFCYWANYSLFQRNLITAPQLHLVSLASMDSGTMENHRMSYGQEL